jgi:hypothetical protein
LGKDNIPKTYATSFDMFTLYTPMLHLIFQIFQEQLPTTSFGKQWYFFSTLIMMLNRWSVGLNFNGNGEF